MRMLGTPGRHEKVQVARPIVVGEMPADQRLHNPDDAYQQRSRRCRGKPHRNKAREAHQRQAGDQPGQLEHSQPVRIVDLHSDCG